jgi:hypothetical protein
MAKECQGRCEVYERRDERIENQQGAEVAVRIGGLTDWGK